MATASPSLQIPKKVPKWSHELAATYFVNSVAICHDGSRVVAATYYYPYQGATNFNTRGIFGTYCYDAAGNRLWLDEFTGEEGVYAVAISGDGKIAAAGGLYSGGKYSIKRDQALLRVYDATKSDPTKNNAPLLDYEGIKSRVNSVALSNDGAVVAAVAANQLYVFCRNAGRFPSAPAIPVNAGPTLQLRSVAIHPSGEWLAACDDGGNVYLITIANGAVQKIYKWTDPNKVPFLSVAISKTSQSFVVGGGDIVYLFTKDSMISGRVPAPVAQCDTPAGGTTQDVRWVAISDDGTFVTAVQNKGMDQAGLLLAFDFDQGQLTLKRNIPLPHNPNSTSMDLSGKHITAGDGHPLGTPGTFHLFDHDGVAQWDCPTPNMNWPMVISADGTAIAGGSDNGRVYYFVP